MAKIVLAPYGSLGDLHPFLAVAVELNKRGHKVKVCTLEAYREKVEFLGVDFLPVRPDFNEQDRELAKRVMDPKRGSERVIREVVLPHLRPMYEDLMEATKGADMLISGEIVFPSHSVAEKRSIKHITTTLAPLSMLSVHEPNILPGAEFLSRLNAFGSPARKLLKYGMAKMIEGWFAPYRDFRRDIGLSEDHDPVVKGKFSKDLHLAMFSKALGRTQPDWYSRTLQTGFCFYDGLSDIGVMPEGLDSFLESGEAPIVFTLGSAAVMDPGNFFTESLKAAKKLNRRAVLLYGLFNETPEGLDGERVGFDYAPFSQIFPKSSCVVHQGGVGTTGQALRAGVPQLIMPYSHDQPDNAARCQRIGVARTIKRGSYTSEKAAKAIDRLLGNQTYKAKAMEAKGIVQSETGTITAADAVESILKMKSP